MNLNFEYDNNSTSYSEKKILNIYKIISLSIPKYARNKIYKIFILILIYNDFKFVLKSFKKFSHYRNIRYFYNSKLKYKKYYKTIISQ